MEKLYLHFENMEKHLALRDEVAAFVFNSTSHIELKFFSHFTRIFGNLIELAVVRLVK